MRMSSHKQISFMLMGCERYGSKTSKSSFGQSTMCVLYFAYNLHDVAMTNLGKR
jgi:hypothetical protein